MRRRMASRCGAILGASQRMVTSTLAMRAAARAHARAGRRSGTDGRARPSSADRVSGKCSPMSPSPIAPSSASVRACRATSASEWPSSACVWAILDAAQPDMIAGNEAGARRSHCRCARRRGAGRLVGHGQILRRGQLAVGLAALHQRDGKARPFGDRGVVGQVRAAGGCGSLVGGQDIGEAEALGVCARHRPARSRVAAMRLSAPAALEGVRDGHGGYGARCAAQAPRSRGR